MEKNFDEIRLIMKEISPKKLTGEGIRKLLGYKTNSETLNAIFDMLDKDLKTIGGCSKLESYQYMSRAIIYINKLTDNNLSSNCSCYNKLKKVVEDINEIKETKNLDEEFNAYLDMIIIKFSKLCRHDFNKMQKSKLKPKTVEVNNTNIPKKEICNEQLVDYLIFNTHDIVTLKAILRLEPSMVYYIKTNIVSIANKLTNEYIHSLLSGEKTKSLDYEAIFMLLLNKKFDFEKAQSQILERLKVCDETVNSLIIGSLPKAIVSNNIKKLLDRVNNYNKEPNIENVNKKYSFFNRKFKINQSDTSILQAKEYEHISDLRSKQNIITIDKIGTTCCDDALSIDLLPNENYQITIYIADVNAYIRPGSIIDKQAYELGSTIYGAVNMPMLPNSICNDKCSLNNDEPKLVHAYSYEVTPKFEIVDFKAENALIKVGKKYNYNKIDSIVKAGSQKNIDIITLYRFAQYLYDQNSVRKTYLKVKELRNPERKNNSNYDNTPGNTIITQLKLLTNYYLAKQIEDLKYPFIYRVNTQTQMNIPNELLESAKQNYPGLSFILKTPLYKSYYSENNTGHSGTGYSAYSKSTTPLREYSSLYNQRIIQRVLIDKNLPDKEAYKLELEIPFVAQHLNERDVINKQYIEDVKDVKKTLTKRK